MESQLSWTKYCHDHILKKMRADKFGTLFATPVLEASDAILPPSIKENYRLVIKRPMDYRTVQAKLDAGAYARPEEFYEDMKLIYDNCMRFNPSVGSSKWAHDAAAANLKKFSKLWQSCHLAVKNLFERERALAQPADSPPAAPQPAPAYHVYQEPSDSSSYIAPSDLNAAVLHDQFGRPLQPNETVALYPEVSIDSGMDLGGNFSGPEVAPFARWSFRLNLQNIQEYKLRKGFLNQDPELNSYSNYLDSKAAMGAEFPHEPPQPGQDSYEVGADGITMTDPVMMPYAPPELDATLDYDELELDPQLEMDLAPPQMLANPDDGVVCVSYLSDAECAALFPEYKIIGLAPEKQRYSASDVSIRSIYNQLYLNDTNVRVEHPLDSARDEPQEEAYTFAHDHPRVRIDLGRVRAATDDTHLTPAKPAPRAGAFEDAETEDDQSDDFKPSLKRSAGGFVPWAGDGADTNGLGGYYGGQDALAYGGAPCPARSDSDSSDSARAAEPADLYIEIDSSSVLNPHGAARLLERNMFSRVAVRDEFFALYAKPQIAVRCANLGFFKLDELDFVFENAVLRHLRIFFFNCATTTVRVSRPPASFTQLVLAGRHAPSAVQNLLEEFKLGNVVNLPFFSLPDSTPIRFAVAQDVLYRLQLIDNSLPMRLVALHVITAT